MNTELRGGSKFLTPDDDCEGSIAFFERLSFFMFVNSGAGEMRFDRIICTYYAFFGTTTISGTDEAQPA